MKISLACDHGGLTLKRAVREHLEALGHQVEDFGTDSQESCDYPDFAAPAAQAVARALAIGALSSARRELAYALRPIRFGEFVARCCPI